MTSNAKIIDSVFPGYKSAKILPSKNIDTISGRFLRERAFARYEIIDSQGRTHKIMIKRKNDLVIPFGAIELSPNFSIFLKVIYAHRIFGFNNGQVREKLFYEKVDDALRKVLPQILDIHESAGGRNVAITMAEFNDEYKIKEKDFYDIIDSITDFHARYFGRDEIIRQMDLNYYSPKDYKRSRKVFWSLFNYYYETNKQIYGPELIKIVAEFIEHIDSEYAEVMGRQTLTHNDFTPRNMAVGSRGIIIYDWELACYQNPEHDLVELLFSAIDEDYADVQIRKLIAYFREKLEIKTQQRISDVEFAKFLRFNALEYCVNRLAIYRSYSKKNHSKMAKRCEKNMRRVLEVCV